MLPLRRCLAVLVSGILLSAVAPTAEAQLRRAEPDAVGLDAAALEQIPKMLQEFIDKGQISGAVVLVSKDGAIAYQTAVGQADVEQGREMKRRTLFAVASMTKPITATALMMLVDEGKVAIDDPVSKYLPEFKSIQVKGMSPAREITLKDVLTHTSGLGGEQRVVGSLEAHCGELVQRGLSFQPGEKWQYSPGLNVVGRVIEVVSGQTYADFLQEKIFKPLRMNSTTFFPTAEQQQELAVLYGPGAEPGSLKRAEHWLVDFSDERVANPSGGLVSTAADMAKFYQLILNKGVWRGEQLLSEESVRALTTIQTGEIVTGFTPGNGWGLGWCVVREPQGVSEMLSPGSCGHGGAFGTQGWIDPTRNMSFVLMIQRTGFGNSDGSDIRQKFQKLAVEAIR